MGLYGALMAVRRSAYARGWLKSYAAELPVVSIGNLEIGGTGKTPCAIALAEALTARGLKVAVVTRGYGGRLKGPLLVETTHAARDVGDEPLLMARAGLRVIKAPDRVAGARLARTTGADIVLLDDGFQHRRLRRDLDIVLVSRELKKARVLPWGCLREPLSALEAADIIIPTKAACGPHQARLKSRALVDVQGRASDLSELAGQSVLAVSAIGQPASFHAELASLGARLTTRSFRDHHQYTPAEIRQLQTTTSKLIVTTEKDMVKLDPAWLDSRWRSLRVGLEIENLAEIIEEIENLVKNRHLS